MDQFLLHWYLSWQVQAIFGQGVHFDKIGQRKPRKLQTLRRSCPPDYWYNYIWAAAYLVFKEYFFLIWVLVSFYHSNKYYTINKLNVALFLFNYKLTLTHSSVDWCYWWWSLLTYSVTCCQTYLYTEIFFTPGKVKISKQNV